MSDWISCKDRLPEMLRANEWASYESIPVLVVVHDTIRVATYEQFDDEAIPEWYTNCSEHWNIGNDVTHWQPLPPMPDK